MQIFGFGFQSSNGEKKTQRLNLVGVWKVWERGDHPLSQAGAQVICTLQLYVPCQHYFQIGQHMVFLG